MDALDVEPKPSRLPPVHTPAPPGEAPIDSRAAASFGPAPLPGSVPIFSAPHGGGAAPLAQIDIVDRDGLPRQSLTVRLWPVTVGRALDNDLVVGDPHVAPHHLQIDADPSGGVELTLGATRNGVKFGRRQLVGGSRTVVAGNGTEPICLALGRSHLRLRLAAQPVADELPLMATTAASRSALLALAALVLADLLFTTWLETDRESFARGAAVALLAGIGGAALWCGAWALLSKTFSRQAHFGWHLCVFLMASVAWVGVTLLPKLAAFAFSWPWASDFDFLGQIAVVAGAFYFHLLGVEPARPRQLRAVAIAAGLAGVLIACWYNLQRGDQLGDELYMSHLFPPALRLARPVPIERLIDRLGTLKEPLDRKAREPGHADESAGPADDEGGRGNNEK